MNEGAHMCENSRPVLLLDRVPLPTMPVVSKKKKNWLQCKKKKIVIITTITKITPTVFRICVKALKRISGMRILLFNFWLR